MQGYYHNDNAFAVHDNVNQNLRQNGTREHHMNNYKAYNLPYMQNARNYLYPEDYNNAYSNNNRQSNYALSREEENKQIRTRRSCEAEIDDTSLKIKKEAVTKMQAELKQIQNEQISIGEKRIERASTKRPHDDDEDSIVEYSSGSDNDNERANVSKPAKNMNKAPKKCTNKSAQDKHPKVNAERRKSKDQKADNSRNVEDPIEETIKKKEEENQKCR